MRNKMTELNIQVIHAEVEQKPIIAQLYELYTYEMTDLADFDIGNDGFYRYKELPLYWTDANKHPYLVWVNKKLAGFILVQQGSPIDEDENIWDIAEFFIMRKFRKKGIGQLAMQYILEIYKGRWQVRVWDNNPVALAFWGSTIKKLSKNTALLTQRKDQGDERLWVYSFSAYS